MKYIIVFILGLSLFSSCEKSEELTPMPLEIMSRFVFPEGNSAFDQKISEINDKYDVKIIYKTLVESDFSRTWTEDLGKMKGSPLKEEDSERHLSFMLEHIFGHLNPNVTKNVFPQYFYLGYHVYSDGTIYTTPQQFLFNGMDYWSLCLEGEQCYSFGFPSEKINFPVTEEQKLFCRGVVLKTIFERAIGIGNIKVPEVFKTDFDYLTPVVNTAGQEEDKNFYKKRGFPGVMNSTITIMIAPLQNIAEMNPARNFISYVQMAMVYDAVKLEKNYPKALFPMIHTYHKIVMDYLLNEYEIDLIKIATV